MVKRTKGPWSQTRNMSGAQPLPAAERLTELEAGDFVFYLAYATQAGGH